MAEAIFSPCKKYRYTLSRLLEGDSLEVPYVNFVCLNPSTADDVRNDPTVFKCMKLTRGVVSSDSPDLEQAILVFAVVPVSEIR